MSPAGAPVTSSSPGLAQPPGRRPLLVGGIVLSLLVFVALSALVILLSRSLCASGSSEPEGFAAVPAGTFEMGIQPEENPFQTNESPRQVTVTRSFWIGVTEVTQRQFSDLMSFNPSSFSRGWPDAPVDSVTWHQAAEYANARSRQEGLGQCFECSGAREGLVCQLSAAFASPFECPGYRLPTEAEWELAARGASSNDPLPVAFDWSAPSCAINPALAPVAWYCGNSQQSTRTVATLQANALGLYDMLGNVHEWCFDWFGPLSSLPVVDPSGPALATHRVQRGGAYNDPAQNVRAGIRRFSNPSQTNNAIGFRLVRTRLE